MLLQALGQTWPPFVLVTGLLLVGRIAAADRLFDAVAARLARAPLGATGLLLAALALVAAVTAVLNLDTAVVFLTPVLVHLARQRGLDERPFLYGTVLMSNAASLLLPGSNLTNLLVGGPPMLPAGLAACAVTAAGVALLLRPTPSTASAAGPTARPGRVGIAATAGAAALVVALPNPALPVLALGVGAHAARRRRPRLDLRLPALLFVFALALGVLARAWDAPADVVATSGRWTSAGLGALASVLVDNLPASVLLSSHQVAHPTALLVGLDVGPNLAVTGSLSAYLWWQAARSVGARPSALAYSALGLVLAPLAAAAALLA